MSVDISKTLKINLNNKFRKRKQREETKNNTSNSESGSPPVRSSSVLVADEHKALFASLRSSQVSSDVAVNSVTAVSYSLSSSSASVAEQALKKAKVAGYEFTTRDLEAFI